MKTSNELKWKKLKPKESDVYHWVSSQEGWTFDIYKPDNSGIPYHLKVTIGDETVDISWFSTLDIAQRSAAGLNDKAIRVLLEIFK